MRDSLCEKAQKIQLVIDRNRDLFGSVVLPSLTKQNTFELKLSDPNNVVAKINPTDADACWFAIENELKRLNKLAAFGGYGEKRTAYRVNTELFGNGEGERCIHIGTDLWMAAETPIYAPMDGIIHSFADNDGLGNYGPTIILAHQLEDETFFTLFGHLTRTSLTNLTVGQKIGKGEPFAAIGSPHENGNWVPHLHYQFITDMMENSGDFPGVATEQEAEFYLNICPEPILTT